MDANPLASAGTGKEQFFPTEAAPTPPTPQPSPAPTAKVDPSTAAAMADNAHHSLVGRAFRNLMGNDVSYSVDPETGNMVSKETPRRGGAIWRGILAGAILGGGVAAKERAPGLIQGVAEGGAAEIDDQRKQDLLKRGQANQEFENQLKAQQNKRAEQSAQTENDLHKAQIAFHNAQTIRENQLIQTTGFEFHEKQAESGRKTIQPFISAGIPYSFKDIGESEMHKMMQNNPSIASLLWEPTGTRVITKPDGSFDHEQTYSAIDPKGRIKLTDDQIKHWKDVGLDKYYPQDQWAVLKSGKELTAEQYMALTQKAQELENQQIEQKKSKTDEEEKQARTALMRAQASHANAEASKIWSDQKDRKIFEEAWATYSSGGDLTKLDPKSRAALSKGLTEIIKTQVDEMRALPKDPATGQPIDQDRLKELYQNTQNYQGILDRIYNVAKPTPAAPAGEAPGSDMVTVKTGDRLGQIPVKELDNFRRDNPDAQMGEDIMPDILARLTGGSTLKLSPKEIPPANIMSPEIAIFTDGRGNYILRDADFQNPQWRLVHKGTEQNLSNLP